MALAYSREMAVGSRMPAFCLKDPDGRIFDSAELFGPKGLLIVFICNHCPYARAQWARLVALAREFGPRGIATAAINSNIHPDYPDDAPPKMKELILELGLAFPYLVDDTQQIARAFDAQCTPDPYLFDREGRLVYHGRIDDNWQQETDVTRHELREAMEALVHGAPPLETQILSMGCSIKWRE